MSEQLRLALVGTGLIGSKGHLPAMAACPRARITALVDPTEERARKLATQFAPDARVAPSVEDVLDDVDAAIVATPNATHRDIAVACLNRGVHVLIEKPLAVTVAEGEEIVEAAESSRSIAAVGYHSRFEPTIDLMKQLLDADYFGTVHRFAYQDGSRGGWAPHSGYSLGETGGGVLIVTGTHFLDRMIYWFGFPSRSRFWDDSRGGPQATAVCRFEFDRDDHTIESEVRFSKLEVLREGFMMETDRGIVELRVRERNAIVLKPEDRPSIQLVLESRGAKMGNTARAQQMEDFVGACLENREPKVPASHGLLTQRLTDALQACREPLDEMI